VLDKVHALWLLLDFIVSLLDVTWEVTVSSVVDMLSWEENVWLVVFIQLLVSKMDVVLNTITISIVNSPWLVSVLEILWSELDQVLVIEGLWGVNNIDELGHKVLGGRFLGLEVRLVIERTGINIFDLRLELGGTVLLDERLWLWVESFVHMAWEVSVSGVMDVLDWVVNWLSESIEFLLSLVLVILNSISVLIDDLSAEWSFIHVCLHLLCERIWLVLFVIITIGDIISGTPLNVNIFFWNILADDLLKLNSGDLR